MAFFNVSKLTSRIYLWCPVEAHGESNPPGADRISSLQAFLTLRRSLVDNALQSSSLIYFSLDLIQKYSIFDFVFQLAGLTTVNDEVCHLSEEDIWYTHSDKQDYPSVAQVYIYTDSVSEVP